MSQSLAPIYIHLIFHIGTQSTRIHSNLAPKLYSYIGGTLRGLNSPALAIGGIEDHIHILLRLDKNKSIAELACKVKSTSSHWTRKQVGYERFEWQGGYGAFSVSASRLEQTKDYIAKQEEHHRQQSTEKEYQLLLDLYGEDYDLRYLLKD